MTMIYAEEVGPRRQIPLLISNYGTNLYIELRAYAPPGVDWHDAIASIYHMLTLEQAKKLRDNLTRWIKDMEEIQRRMASEHED